MKLTPYQTVLFAATAVTLITACGDNTSETGQSQAAVSTDNLIEVEEISASTAENTFSTDSELMTALANEQLPYPVYPEAEHYRIGTENNLKVVLFQTDDPFNEVDAWFQEQADLARLPGMEDYVRYSTDQSDNDPWATARPGIVIHRFNSADERAAVGADDTAQTHIIMSFEQQSLSE